MALRLMACKTCMTLRAKFVRWLGVKLGVMRNEEPIKEKKMEMNIDQLMAIIGNKEVELIALRMEVARLNALLKPEDKPKLAAVE